MIKTFDYRRSLPEIEAEVMNAVARVLHSGRLLLGPETEAFEAEFATLVGATHCVAVASGTAALHLALLALDIGSGDEVVTVSNTCVPTVAAIRLTGAQPAFVDVRERDLLMDPGQVRAAITGQSRCILPVHLWGHSVDLDAVTAIAGEHGLPVVEDCAQAHGTRYRDRHVGTWGRLGCFSFYPTKNLGAFGDAGAVVTDDADLAARLRRLRVYGYDDAAVSHTDGLNARIAEIQAAVLRVKLQVFPDWLARRRRVAALYDETIRHEGIRLPLRQAHTEPSFHQYVVRCVDRDGVCAALRDNGIEYGIHYPVPVHAMPAYASVGGAAPALPITDRAAGEILSLPIHEALSNDEVRRVAETLNAC